MDLTVSDAQAHIRPRKRKRVEASELRALIPWYDGLNEALDEQMYYMDVASTSQAHIQPKKRKRLEDGATCPAGPSIRRLLERFMLRTYYPLKHLPLNLMSPES
ncbi:hypothetical protein B0H10DRAFT_1948925 [Mycena sp. CBHHK59/15]|nr:hypothetical protein B0H10DRAFT_1956008 [Mycena sp. CBHHK59/15]KAJ6608918.1 hypothetical protein B0H10DRAFT_1955036 [Mycena sp. CBHHK59/15]KAJ6616768.1 hypothetical protein B0H10DRAFT_1948925 [Mycena sp. CBHHK59/15]